MSIRPLPEDVVEKIKSSSAITSLNQVISGLLKNSLDAASTRVNIRVDYVRGHCTVEDDGLGIEPREFAEGGGLGRRHYTSRFPCSPCYHGSRGDFLASLAGLCLLSVTSHHHRYVSQGFVSFHGFRVLTRQHPASPEQRLETFNHGTRVSVRSLFGNVPVRLKHQAAVFSDRAGVDKEWANLVRDAAALLLAWPSQISLFLTEGSSRRELRIKSTANVDMVTRTSRIFSQVCLSDADAESWIPVSATLRRIRVRGCICAAPSASRRSQILSIGIQPIINDQGSNVLYEAINEVFKNSSFGVIDDGPLEAPGNRPGKPRKGLERWPMFFLQITLPGNGLSIDGNNDSDEAIMLTAELLKALSFEFLKKQRMSPRAISSATKRPTLAEIDGGPFRSSSLPTSVLKRKPARWDAVTRLSPFDDWNRIKVGWAVPHHEITKSTSVSRGTSETSEGPPRLIGNGGKLLRLPFEDDTKPMEGLARDVSSHAFRTKTAKDAASKVEQGSSPFFDAKQREPQAREKGPKPEPSAWLQSIIQTWQNPVFEVAETRIPSCNHAADSTQQCRHEKEGVGFEAGTMNLHGRLSRSALFSADVIAQVDRKFILVQLPLQSASGSEGKEASSALVMIDQHAADERCRLETLFQEYFRETPQRRFEASGELLEQPVVFEVSAQEAQPLEQYRAHFAHWGIRYTVKGGLKTDSPSRVVVTSLPPSIIERCRTEPRLLIDLVRKEIWALADGHSKPRKTADCHEFDGSWASRFCGCPSGILELLYSRSCRSAIMFNDELSRDECVELVRRLGHCAFPFQCAHGRPSMVPMVETASAAGLGRGWREPGPTGMEKWKTWME